MKLIIFEVTGDRFPTYVLRELDARGIGYCVYNVNDITTYVDDGRFGLYHNNIEIDIDSFDGLLYKSSKNNQMEIIVDEFQRRGIWTCVDYNHMEYTSNKMVTMNIFRRAGLPIIASAHCCAANIENIGKYGIEYPVISKPACNSCGRKVYLSRDEDELKNTYRYNTLERTVFEHQVNNTARDIRIDVINGEAAVAYWRQGADYKSNISAGGYAEKFELTDEIRDIARRAVAALGTKQFVYGLDIIYDSNGKDFYIMEINTAPGLVGVTQTGQQKAFAVAYVNGVEDCIKKFKEKH